MPSTEERLDTDIWFPFYYGDYLKDTMQLSAERHGIYLLFMIHCWQNGSIENDPESISMIAKVDSNSTAPKYILDKYFKYADGEYTHSRVTKEKELAKENKIKRSEKAKKAAEARWNNDATSNAPSIPTSNAQGYAKAMPELCPSPSPSSSHISSTAQSPKKYDPSKDLVFFYTDEFQEVWKDYKAVRTKKKASNSDRAIKKIITSLKTYSGNNKEEAIRIIEKSADSWSESILYPPTNI